MSINNIVLKDKYSGLLGNTHQLPFELSSDGSEVLQFCSSTARQPLTIKSHESMARPIHIMTKDGYIYLTNKRFVYITALQGDINTFSIDLNLASALQFSHKLKSPWFGANYWEFIFFSASNPILASDGFPKDQWFRGQIGFNDGGLFNFVEKFDHILNDAVNNIEIDEDLPRYTPL